jgi:preprotein translocase subunit SecA
VLNAKQHAKEAEIVAQAGRPGVITIATNMAGRGTDIVLGGNVENQIKIIDADESIPAEEKLARAQKLKDEWQGLHDAVKAQGGLRIIATERHESRRIDNQLRGRSGRQGDPGSSRFYLSLEDDLMRIFGSDRISGLMQKLGMEEGIPIEHGMVTRSIERAQRQVEAQNFAARKHLLEYDDVMNKQREAVYGMRRMILEGKDTRQYVLNLASEVLDWYFDSYTAENQDPEQWNLAGLRLALKETYGIDVPLDSLGKMGRAEMAEAFAERIRTKYDEKERQVGPELMLFHQRMIMLQIVDTQWKDHLYGLDHLKEGIGLRGYGQRDPLVEYKKESFDMFQALMDRIDEEILRWVFLYQPVPSQEQAVGSDGNGGGAEEEPPPPVIARHPRRPRGPEPADAAVPPELSGFGSTPPWQAGGAGRGGPRNLTFNDPSEALSGSGGAAHFAGAEPKEAHGGADGSVETVRREGPKVGRNDPCPCGSGKKYKKCHGA